MCDRVSKVFVVVASYCSIPRVKLWLIFQISVAVFILLYNLPEFLENVVRWNEFVQ